MSRREGDEELMQEVVDHIVSNISLLADRDVVLDSLAVRREGARPAGADRVHISFRMGFKDDAGASLQGCVLVPLPDALALAYSLMMYGDDEVAAHREDVGLDRTTKEALLELGIFMAAAVDEVFRKRLPGTFVRAEGCQGVRADVRPALEYREGDDLVVGRAVVSLGAFPSFTMLVLLPVLPQLV